MILKLTLVVVFVGAVFTAVESKKALLNDGRNSAKLLRMQEGARNLATLIRNVEIKTPADGCKFTDMINEMVFKTDTTLSDLSQAIPSVRNRQIHDNLVEILLGFSDASRQVKRELHGPSDKLKECFVDVLDKSGPLLRKVAQVLENDECKKEVFLLNQLRRIFNRAIFSILKLKLETEFFHKPIKDLESEIDSSLEALCKSLQNVKSDDPKSKDELIYLIEELENVHDLAYMKLKNYEHVSDIDDKTLTTVNEVIQKLSESSNRFSQLTEGTHEMAQLKTEFEKLFRAATGLAKKLTGCEVAVDTPGEYYIRSTVFDGIALSKFCERELTDLNKS